MKVTIGIITAILFSFLLIWSVEHDYSMWQLLVGFTAFILPTIFFSEIKGNIYIFMMLTFTILFLYMTYKWEYYNVYVGNLLAIIVGFPIHYFKVKKVGN